MYGLSQSRSCQFDLVEYVNESPEGEEPTRYLQSINVFCISSRVVITNGPY